MLVLPLGDDHPSERRPYVNFALIAANILVYLLSLSANPEGLIRWMLVPADVHATDLVTSLFLHANLWHLGGNMLFLWIFGSNVEDRLGHLGYLAFYLASGVAAAAAHILGNLGSAVPTLGASGAISGVMGAYIVFFPNYRVKTFVWFFVILVRVFRIPALLWIGFWFLEQVLLNSLTGSAGGVAYLAHIGGFVFGAAIAGGIRFVSDRWPPARLRDRDSGESWTVRRPFAPLPEETGVEWMDEPGDGYSLLRLSDDPSDVPTIAKVVARASGEASEEIARRLEATRGMVVRAVSRETATRIQRDLHTQGIPSAIILHSRSNLPPPPTPVEGASWDDRALRLRLGDHIAQVPWTGPFLIVGARVEGRAHLDVFLSRRTCYRIADSGQVPLVEVDSSSRSEAPTDLSGFARAATHRAVGASLNAGVQAAAGGGGWGWLDFRSPNDYDDYIFWLFNLVLARSARA